MNLLTIDTSTATCSVALTCGDRLLAEQVLSGDQPLSSHILACVDAVMRGSGLALTDLDGIGVALGPGAFTGLRVGVATVKGLALSTGKPVVGFSSLAMLAMNLPWAAHPVCPMFDARKKEVYTGIYTCRDLPEALIADCAASPESFLKMLDGPTIFVGDGVVRYREQIVDALGDDALFAPSSAHQPRASVGALLARQGFLKGESTPLPLLNPVYIRPSEAELAKAKQKI